MGEITWYITALVMGLAGSLHCLAMCGPIFAAVGGFYEKPSQFVKPVIMHHAGKMVSYAALGLLMGAIGQTLSLVVIQNQLMLICGIILLLIAAGGMLKSGWLKGFQSWVNMRMSALLKAGGFGPLLLGLVNGLVPCGLVYAAAVGAAATQTWWQGALFMVFFSLGTMPSLTLAGFSRWLIPLRRMPNLAVWKQIPTLLLGALLFLKGLSLGIPYISPDVQAKDAGKNCCKPAQQVHPH